jgi:hypothetical protein
MCLASCASQRNITALVKVRAYANPGLAALEKDTSFSIVVSDAGNKLISEQLKEDLWGYLISYGMRESMSPRFTFVLSADENYQVVKIPGVTYSWPVAVTEKTAFSAYSLGAAGVNTYGGNIDSSSTSIQNFQGPDQEIDSIKRLVSVAVYENIQGIYRLVWNGNLESTGANSLTNVGRFFIPELMGDFPLPTGLYRREIVVGHTP